MQTVTITFINSMNQERAATFDIYTEDQLSSKEFSRLVMSYPGGDVNEVYEEDWSGEDYRVEKMAALQAGIEKGQPFVSVLKEIK